MLRYLKFSRTRLVVVVGFAVLATLYSVYWFVMATNLKNGLSTWSQEILDEGFQINYHRIETSGFPTTFRFVLEGPSLTAKTYSQSEAEIDWLWHGSQVIIEITPWNINRSRIDISGKHDIIIGTKKKHHRFCSYFGNIFQIKYKKYAKSCFFSSRPNFHVFFDLALGQMLDLQKRMIASSSRIALILAAVGIIIPNAR